MLVVYTKIMLHKNCRSVFYPFGKIKRLQLDDKQIPWDVEFTYDPPEYESPSLQNKPYADPSIEDVHFNPKFNAIDGKIDRTSHMGTYKINEKRPLNPYGRTGLKGRGVLGRWGPNHAADPIVTKWKLDNGKKKLDDISKLPILQFCGIQRRDCDEWAIPGGMIDPGENANVTLRREFLEEALNSKETNKEETIENEKIVNEFFKNGIEIYKGYVDDPRNTDNAWIETVAMNFHDESGNQVGKFPLKAGDDAKNIKWIDINKNLKLYANHLGFIQKVIELHKAHW